MLKLTFFEGDQKHIVFVSVPLSANELLLFRTVFFMSWITI